MTTLTPEQRLRPKCIRCGQPPARTPQLNLWTKKGLIHVGCRDDS